MAYLASERAPRRPVLGAAARDLAIAAAFLEPPATAPVSAGALAAAGLAPDAGAGGGGGQRP